MKFGGETGANMKDIMKWSESNDEDDEEKEDFGQAI
jgi:hypothetical protein